MLGLFSKLEVYLVYNRIKREILKHNVITTKIVGDIVNNKKYLKYDFVYGPIRNQKECDCFMDACEHTMNQREEKENKQYKSAYYNELGNNVWLCVISYK